jgi:hypothetical protein
MSIRWQLFRIVCLLQMLASSFFTITALVSFIETISFTALVRLVLFLFIFLLTILAVNILNKNYPDVPVAGKQKTNFNRLFLFNFLFLIFLFGIIIAECRQLMVLAELISRPLFKLPFEFLVSPIINIVMLIFQLTILYGLYQLRRELYFNFTKKEFEFEKHQR